MRRLVLIAAALLVSLLVASRAFAAPVAEVTPSTTYLPLAPYLDVLEDPSGHLTIDDVRGGEGAARFRPFAGRVGPNYAYTTLTIWVRFAVENTTDVALERWIAIDMPFANDVEIFRDGEPPATQGATGRAGAELSRAAYTFRLTLAPHQRRSVYLRSGGDAEVRLPLELWDLGELAVKDRIYARVAALALGVMAALALYNAFLFVFIRERGYLYYAGYLVCIGLWCTCLDGSLLDALPGSVARIPRWANTVSMSGALLFSGLFMRSVLGLAARPRLDRFVLGTVAVILLLALVRFTRLLDYRTFNVLVRAAIYSSIFGWIVVAAMRWRDGLSAAKYVTLGWTVMVVISLLMQLALFGDLPRSAWLAPPSITFAVEAVLLSLALADAARNRDLAIVRLTQDRVTELEDRNREVGQLNEELRRQVAERSRELTEALARSEGRLPPTALEVGDLFEGRYLVRRALGRGGMGAVYEVERSIDGRRFALKVVTGALWGLEAARFTREAEIGATLRHDNLVSIVDVGMATAGAPYLVMELVLGGTMDDHRNRFGDVAWALPILGQIAAGLAVLHEHHIVHRDLKPANVLLVAPEPGRGSIAKISDFGISRLGVAGDEGASTDPPLSDRAPISPSPRALTQSGGFLGTPLYMPPEALHRPARHSSADVFSFGILAYEALTGRPPFVTAPVLAGPGGMPAPAPIEGVPEPIAVLVLACMSIDPAARPRAREVADALGRVG